MEQPNESPDRVRPSPEQEQITNILNLAEILSAKNITASGIWRDGSYSVPDLGDSIISISVSRLTKEGERKNPKFPLAIINISRRNEDGIVQTYYEIFKSDDQLRIDKDELATLNEDEEKPRSEKLMNLSREEAMQSLEKISKKLREIEQERDFERSIGATYVDHVEAQEVIDILTKLQAKRKLNIPS